MVSVCGFSSFRGDLFLDVYVYNGCTTSTSCTPRYPSSENFGGGGGTSILKPIYINNRAPACGNPVLVGVSLAKPVSSLANPQA